LSQNCKYVLDLKDLQYKRVRLHWKTKLSRFLVWFTVSLIFALIYGAIFEKLFGSPKEKILTQQVENMKLQYSFIGRELDNSMALLGSFRLSDDIRYRPILDMDVIPESYRKAGYGGVDRYRDPNVQNESFKTIAERTSEWKREMDHQPMISPVSVKFRLGDPYRFRESHPVTGEPRMHYGQDFEVPYGTDIYATGDGTVIESGYNTGGYGNYVVIDHGYGLQTTYGHLSEIRVPKGLNVKRGDLLGLSGSTGSSTGPHLHYEIKQFGEHKNPIYFFNNDMSEEEFTEMIQELGSKTKFR